MISSNNMPTSYANLGYMNNNRYNDSSYKLYDDSEVDYKAMMANVLVKRMALIEKRAAGGNENAKKMLSDMLSKTI